MSGILSEAIGLGLVARLRKHLSGSSAKTLTSLFSAAFYKPIDQDEILVEVLRISDTTQVGHQEWIQRLFEELSPEQASERRQLVHEVITYVFTECFLGNVSEGAHTLEEEFIEALRPFLEPEELDQLRKQRRSWEPKLVMKISNIMTSVGESSKFFERFKRALTIAAGPRDGDSFETVMDRIISNFLAPMLALYCLQQLLEPST